MLVFCWVCCKNNSHLNATVNKDYGLEAIGQSLQVFTQQFNDRLTKRQSKLKVRGQHNSYGSFGAWK